MAGFRPLSFVLQRIVTFLFCGIVEVPEIQIHVAVLFCSSVNVKVVPSALQLASAAVAVDCRVLVTF